VDPFSAKYVQDVDIVCFPVPPSELVRRDDVPAQVTSARLDTVLPAFAIHPHPDGISSTEVTGQTVTDIREIT